MNYIVAAATDIGITKQTNQDSYSVKAFNTPQGKMVFAILCDGMGGLEKGELASGTLVHAFNQWTEQRLPALSGAPIEDAVIRKEWVDIATEYNNKIKMYGRSSAINLGTTLTAMLLTEKRYYVINVGDTRAYEITDSANTITSDQTVVAREIALGNLTEEEAKTDPRRSVLLQCVGASDAIYPDMFFGATKKDAVYMLCSDGFRHEVTAEEIHAYLKPEVMMDFDGMQQNMKSLIELNKQRQETDNITVVTVRTF